MSKILFKGCSGCNINMTYDQFIEHTCKKDFSDSSIFIEEDAYDLINSIKQIFNEGCNIISRKNQDYATSDDPFKNFRSAEILSVSVEQAILIRTLDKMSRIGNCINKDSTIVIEETVEDTILDAINYLALLLAYRRYKQNETKPKEQ